MRAIVLRYRVKPDVDLAALERDIAEFVAGLGRHPATVSYRSMQLREEPRRFVHVGEFHEEHVASLQEQPFFVAFTTSLRERCDEGPTVTAARRVASTP